jgi:hypothetical protein
VSAGYSHSFDDEFGLKSSIPLVDEKPPGFRPVRM